MDLKTSKPDYNHSYSFVTPDWLDYSNLSNINQFLEQNNESLINFIDDYLDRFTVNTNSLLDLGCGLGGLSFNYASHFNQVTALDISPLAIMGAKEIQSYKNTEIDFKELDITNSNLNQKFDLIVDSHLLHCLLSTEDRAKYYSFIKEHLEENGHALIESMTFQKNIECPMEYYFDENSNLFHNDRLYRKVLSTRELEEEILAAGLKINYLYYHDELSFNVFTEYPEYPFEKLPKTTRLSVSLR